MPARGSSGDGEGTSDHRLGDVADGNTPRGDPLRPAMGVPAVGFSHQATG